MRTDSRLVDLLVGFIWAVEWLPSGDVALVDEDVAPLNARKAEPRSNLKSIQLLNPI